MTRQAFAEMVKMRLKPFGIEITESDEWQLNFVLDEVESRIKDFCNLKWILSNLQAVAVNMAAANFLLEKKSLGQIPGIDLDPQAKQIKEGDTSVTFATGEGSLTPEQRLDTLISNLQSKGEKQLLKNRRMRW